MKKIFKFSLFLASCLLLLSSSFFLLPSFASADPGVVIEAKGKVTIEQGARSIPAQTGTPFSDGATIKVANDGKAVLMFNNGATKKLAAGEKFVVTKTLRGQSAGKPIIKGITMAYNDATSKSRGPTVHAMVKEAVPEASPASASGDKQLDPAKLKEMRSNLGRINLMNLDKNGEALMRAQIYYKFGQNQKMVNTLLPVYRSQNPPADMVKGFLVLGYQKMGKMDEAEKYK